jgi:hypothetical protein
MILLDFFSGSHGHFLEYVINTYIYNGPRVQQVFTELGTAHGIRQDLAYQAAKQVHSAHYSEFNIPVAVPPTKVIRIVVNNLQGRVCYLININNRAGDIPSDKKNLQLPANLRDSPKTLRNTYYSKFLSDEYGYELPSRWKFDTVPIFEFEMTALYDIFEFYKTLRNLAEFLGHKLTISPELTKLWKEFIQFNHGINSWQRCNNLLPDIFAGNNVEFALNIEEQAILNQLLSQSIGIFDGSLFENDVYPSNTLDVWKCVQHHIDTFDARF